MKNWWGETTGEPARADARPTKYNKIEDCP
jgi:hypothetical protein